MIELRSRVSRFEPVLLLIAGIACVLFAAWPGAPFSLTAPPPAPAQMHATKGALKASSAALPSRSTRSLGVAGGARSSASPSQAPRTASRPPIGDEALQREIDQAAPRDLNGLAQQGNLNFLDDLLPGFENGVAVETFEDWHPAKHANGNPPAVPAPAPRAYFDPEAEP